MTLRRITLLAAITLLAPSTQGATITGLYNTGVGANGTVLGFGQEDTHYSLLLDGVPTAARAISPHQAWAVPPTGSAWIGVANSSGETWVPPGTYSYTLTMTVDFRGHSTERAQIAGWWATDNTGEIWINGVQTQWTKSLWGFTSLDFFLIETGFVEGINTLEFRVWNEYLQQGGAGYNPSGLLVAGLVAVDDGSIRPLPPPCVPESASFLTGAFILLPIGIRLLRRGC